MATLQVQPISRFAKIATDVGSEARKDITLFRPNPIPDGWFFMGDVGVNEIGSNVYPTNSSFIIQQVGPDDPQGPLLMTGLDPSKAPYWLYEHDNLIIALPNGQSGPNANDYVAIGIIGLSQDPDWTQNNYLNWGQYVFVRKDQCVVINNSQLGTVDLYDDAGSHSRTNITLWTLPYSGLIVASTGTDGSYPSGIYYDLNPAKVPSMGINVG